MAEIFFGTYGGYNLQGSGLGFYGSTFGSSVQIGSYQSKTYITNGAGTIDGGNAHNVKFGGHAATGIGENINSGVPLVLTNASQRTLDITFGHDTPVLVQNVQFKIYDRESPNNPASGVNTKVAELVNFSNAAWPTWINSPGANNTNLITVGSGDLFWWGEPWPANNTSQNYYENSVGVKFYNGLDSSPATNGDVRLQGITGGDDTVGGTGLVVPLLNSPGSGGRYLHSTLAHLGTQKVAPKWKQYYNQGNLGTGGAVNVGTPGLYDSSYTTFGGSGYDTHHTWRVAISATPLSIGSKEKYGAYVSLEYL